MKSLQDALYNWLTIRVVCVARPDDSAARETEMFFMQMLKNDHQVIIDSVSKIEPFYFVEFLIGDEMKKQRFPIELIDIMLDQIQLEPDKYKNIE
ncbi:hypothetical protein JFV29_05200 [Peribacillus sp. TH16]|uniref:hypothetical protein n=1 Tax=Peribacillus sp. TH16 TaxID=2798482 RepID=UPI0019135A95|nr:hypothetical protein [Peribacillus sp. TH16]MBK5481332.1 hypothetical protein [Peribacillus sp. TH16]